MNNEKTGGSAFPFEEVIDVVHAMGVGKKKISSPGMTMRDYFAAKAMAAAMSRSGFADVSSMRKIAESAYQQADAMLAAREVQP